MRIFETDVLIQGDTLAGWMAAYTLLSRRDCRVLMLKDTVHEASSRIDEMNVPLLPGDSAQAYYADVRRAGAWQNDPALVRALCGDSADALNDLRSLGLPPLPSPSQGRAVKLSGASVVSTLSKACQAHPGFRLMAGEGLRLMKKDGRVQGALGWDDAAQSFFAVSLGAALVTGRCGSSGSASGFSMAYYAGAEMADLEFIAEGIPLPEGGEISLSLGGVVTDEFGRTRVPGLLAAGEMIAGIHGAGFDPGNLKTASLVFGRRAGNTLAKAEIFPGAAREELLSWAEETAAVGAEDREKALLSLQNEISDSMAGLRYTADSLEAALQTASHAQHELNELPPLSPPQAHARLLTEDRLIFCRLHLLSALERRDSVGCFRREDDPNPAPSPYRVRMGLAGMILFPEKQDWRRQGDKNA